MLVNLNGNEKHHCRNCYALDHGRLPPNDGLRVLNLKVEQPRRLKNGNTIAARMTAGRK